MLFLRHSKFLKNSCYASKRDLDASEADQHLSLGRPCFAILPLTRTTVRHRSDLQQGMLE